MGPSMTITWATYEISTWSYCHTRSMNLWHIKPLLVDDLPLQSNSHITIMFWQLNYSWITVVFNNHHDPLTIILVVTDEHSILPGFNRTQLPIINLACQVSPGFITQFLPCMPSLNHGWKQLISQQHMISSSHFLQIWDFKSATCEHEEGPAVATSPQLSQLSNQAFQLFPTMSKQSPKPPTASSTPIRFTDGSPSLQSYAKKLFDQMQQDLQRIVRDTLCGHHNGVMVMLELCGSLVDQTDSG